MSIVGGESGTEEIEPQGMVQKSGPCCRFNYYTLASSVLASMTSTLLGYDIGVMSGAVLFIRDDMKLSSAEVEMLVGSLNICSLVGSLASGKTSDLIGRKYTIVLASATFIMGAVLMGLASSFSFLMAGRAVAGIGVGYSLMIAPVYNAELAPAATRGFFASLPEVFINLGILLGYLFSYVMAGLPERWNWRLMLGIAALPATVVAFGAVLMPESPRWLVMKGRGDEARRILIKASRNTEEAELRLARITEATVPSPMGAWRELLLKPSRPLRRILATAIVINFFMQASGNDAVVYYCPEVFKTAGIRKKKELVGVTAVMGLVKTVFVLISAGFLDRFGRRPLLLVGSVGITVSLIMLGICSKLAETAEEKPRWAVGAAVVAVCADVSFFSIGLGPITWVYSSEIFPTRVRAQGTSIAISVNRVVSGAVSMSFLSVAEAISVGGTFLVYAGISAAGAVVFYFFLPETRGRSLEEVESLFHHKDGGGGAGGAGGG